MTWHKLRWAAVGAAVLALAVWLGVSFEGRPIPEDEWRFVERVFLYDEYGDFDGVVTRWVESPKITLVNASREDREIVEELIRELNDVLEGTRITLSLGTLEESNIRVFFAPLAEFPALGQELGFEYVEGNAGFFATWGNDSDELTFADVMIADELAGKARRTMILQEITQTLGPANDSPIFPSSIFFETNRSFATATRLAPIDRKLLRFLYAHLEPGDGPREVRQAFEAHWVD